MWLNPNRRQYQLITNQCIRSAAASLSCNPMLGIDQPQFGAGSLSEQLLGAALLWRHLAITNDLHDSVEFLILKHCFNHRTKSSKKRPNNILAKPKARILRLLIWANLTTKLRHRCGYKKGKIPSMISIKQSATSKCWINSFMIFY